MKKFILHEDNDNDDNVDDDDYVIKGTLALKLAQLMAELFRGNCEIINDITTDQLDAFISQLRTTKVIFYFD